MWDIVWFIFGVLFLILLMLLDNPYITTPVKLCIFGVAVIAYIWKGYIFYKKRKG